MGYITTASMLILAYSVGTLPTPPQSVVFHNETKTQTDIECGQINKLGVILETQQPKSGEQNQAIGINWNRVVDLILDIAKTEILRLGKDEVDLPDVEEVFTEKVFLVKLRGEFKADKGRLNSLSTVRRTGDVKVTRKGTAFTVVCVLGLGTVHLRYDHYRAKINGVGSVSGYVKGDVGTNSIRVTATIDVKDGKCTASLNDVKVVELKGLKVKVSGSGFGPLNWLISKATNSYAQTNKQDIIVKIEQGLSSEIAKTIHDLHCDQYIGLLLI